MKTITNSQEFAVLLQAERAVVFTFFDWSGSAHVSLKLFEEWEHEWVSLNPASPIVFARINPDDFRDCWDWLALHAQGDEGMDGGFGATIWVRRGRGIGFVRFTAKAGKETLSRLTREYFHILFLSGSMFLAICCGMPLGCTT